MIWLVLDKRSVPRGYIGVIKDIYAPGGGGGGAAVMCVILEVCIRGKL